MRRDFELPGYEVNLWWRTTLMLAHSHMAALASRGSEPKSCLAFMMQMLTRSCPVVARKSTILLPERIDRISAAQETSLTFSHEIRISHDAHVALVEFAAPPHNFASIALITDLADALSGLDADPDCRAVVLASSGSSFCAGADFNAGGATQERDPSAFYSQAMRLFDTAKPIVAAVHGAAIGAGLGLALIADFRVTCKQARLSANFNRLGIHPGFGMSVTLPRLVGAQQAARLFYTGRRLSGDEAVALGLADALAEDGAHVRPLAQAWAKEIAGSAPLAVQATRQTLRAGLAQSVREVNQRELAIQRDQFVTQDFREGVAAMAERREPVFIGA